MEDSALLIIQLLSGVVGGNMAGKIFSSLSPGTLGNSIAGILGGGIAGTVLKFIGRADAGTSFSGILVSVAVGAVGGVVIMRTFGALKNAFVK